MGSELGITVNTKPQANLDSVGIWWICWATIWTAFLAGGFIYLIYNRHLPILRIRGLTLSLFAITLLHLYWVSCQIGYVIGPLAPAEPQYWIMGLYLPLGIALFQASNLRFLDVAKKQKKYAELEIQAKQRSDITGNGLVSKLRRASYNTQVLITVGTGMVFQIFLTVFMYLISRKFHRSWGIPGTEINGTPIEQMVEMGRGWEWWPTCFWQFFWAWFVAPYVLWKARHVNDTQGWRLQTIGCCLVGLPATPMWLIAIYVPAMEAVNRYWVPPQWICLSIWFMEIFTVFVPCWQVLRHRTLHQETLDSIAQWESRNKYNVNSAKSLHSYTTVIDSILTGKKSAADSMASSSNESILTMSALEYVLERNPAPLLQFSALRDFSGENIAFLTSVSEWKSSLPPTARNSGNPSRDPQTRELVRERFNRALRIYAQFISRRDADFPINISSQDLKSLESIFETSARILYGEKREIDAAAPFNTPIWNKSTEKETASETPTTSITDDCMEDRVQYWGDIPESFNETVFDRAEDSIKYLVLTNTWPKFVKDRRSAGDTGDV